MRILTTLVLLALINAGCGGNNQEGDNKQSDTTENEGITKITAGGATFPYPLYDKMFREYGKDHDIEINYQAIGSGGGIRQLKNKTVDFGASDAFLDKQEMASLDGEVLHVPTCLGAVVLAYKLEGIEDLKLTPEIIAGIALGNIEKWDHEKIQKANPDKDLPDKSVVFVHRSDGSGTNFIFTDYLYKTNDEWKNQVGRGKTVEWPTGIGAKGNAGVTRYITQAPGRLGYIELSYAKKNDLSIAHVKNQSGNFIEPTVKSTSKAADVDLPDDTRVTLTNTKAEKGYPISSFTWLLLYQEQAYNNHNKEKVKTIVDLMNWMITDAQSYAEPLHYAPLPEPAIRKAQQQLQKVTFNGNSVLEPDKESAQ